MFTIITNININERNLINNGKWVYVVLCRDNFGHTSFHCDVTEQMPCKQPWQTLKGPGVFKDSDILMARMLP